MLRHRGSLVIALTAALLGSVCQVFVPLIARQIVDRVVIARDSPLVPWLTLLIVLSLAVFGLTFLRRYRGGLVALSVQNDLRTDMHRHLQGMDFASLGTMPTGQLVARANSDTALVQGLLNMVPIMSGNILLMLFSLVVMFILSPPLALVSLAITPVLAIVSYRMRAKIFPATWDAQQREGEVAQIVDEDVSGVRVVKAFGREQREVERVAEAASRLYGSQLRAVRLQARFQPMLQAIPTLGQVTVLAFGGWLALEGQLTIGTFLAFSAYIAQLMAPARQLAGILMIGQQARVGVERIFQLLAREPAIADAPHAVELPEGGGAIEFEGVRFGYGREAAVLDGFSLRIAPGERVALVGPSGSGKSTAAALIPRFYDPEDGTVRIDGMDVREVTLRSLRSRIGMVFEESFLFSDTVRANIAYGRPDASEEEIRAAARIAEAGGFIERLPRGYETVVGERGLSLSGGQRQRIALARAILADPRVLILDDATSAVDATTETAIHQQLRTVLGSRTVLLIAHRESTLRLADRIVVVEGGRVVDEGGHEELLQRIPAYRALITGLDEELQEASEGRIEALATMADGQVTASAWSGGGQASPAIRPNSRAMLGFGGGGGRGGGRGGRIAALLTPTPELLARVAALGPVRDVPELDLGREAAPDPAFSLPRLLAEFRRPLLLGLLLVVLDAGLGLLGPVLTKTGVDEGVEAGSATVLFVASGLFLLVTLAGVLDGMAQILVMGRVAQRVMLSLRIRIWAKLQRLSLDYYEREMGGRIMTRMTTDVDQFETLIQNGLLSALVSIVTFCGVGVALLVVNLPLGLCTLSVVVPLAIATVAFQRRASRLYDVSRDRIAIVNADFQESFSGVRESQAFVHEARTVERFERLSDSYLRSRLASQRLVATYFPFVQFLSGVADAIVLGVGAVLIASGDLTSGALIAFILYIDMFFSPIQQLSQVFDAWQQTRVSVGRIAELMALETLTPDAPEPRDPGRVTGSIALAGVHFRYPEAPPRPGLEQRGPSDPRLMLSPDALERRPPEALRGIELAIAPHETLALVGETGAGKSTIVKLLARFYDPSEGRVLVDGQDLRMLDLGGFRRQLGYVPQEAFLFTGSVRDNIAFGRPDASDAQVEAAARAVGAHDFIAGLSGGYRHELAERGRSLSAGQRQLLALARAELVDPAVLLLDEATSNLDLVTEARVTAAMRAVSRGRTTVVIAHRLQTARGADRIAVLQAGGLVELGSHEELLERGGRYAAMWRAFVSSTTTPPAAPS